MGIRRSGTGYRLLTMGKTVDDINVKTDDIVGKVDRIVAKIGA